MFIIKKIKNLLKYIWHELKDWKNLIIFAIVCIVVGSSVWLPLLLGFITGNAWWYGIAAAIEAIWLGPVPFLPICFGITIIIRKIINKMKRK